MPHCRPTKKQQLSRIVRTTFYNTFKRTFQVVVVVLWFQLYNYLPVSQNFVKLISRKKSTIHISSVCTLPENQYCESVSRPITFSPDYTKCKFYFKNILQEVFKFYLQWSYILIAKYIFSHYFYNNFMIVWSFLYIILGSFQWYLIEKVYKKGKGPGLVNCMSVIWIIT